MKRDYHLMDDDELIQLLRDGESAVTDYFMDKYKYLVRSKAGSMHILGGDRDDLIQEGMIGLFKALRDYDMGRDASFSTFASLCISRQMYTAVQASGRKKHSPLNNYISLSQTSDDGERGEMMELLNGLSSESPEQALIDRENMELLLERIDSILSPLERQVLELHLTGMDYIEIARVLGRNPKSTDNALQRIRSKLRK